MVKFTEDSRSSNRMLELIISNTGNDTPMLTIIDPISSYDQGRAFLVNLKSIAGKNKIYFGFAKKDYITDAFSDSSFSKISEHSTKKYLKDHLLNSVKNRQDINCVAVFPKLEKKFLEENKDWFIKIILEENSLNFIQFISKSEFCTIYFKF